MKVGYCIVKALLATMQAQSISERQLSKDTGVNRSTWRRTVAADRELTVDEAVLFCRYLGLNVERVFARAIADGD